MLLAGLWLGPAVWGLAVILRSSEQTHLRGGAARFRLVFGALLALGLGLVLLGCVMMAARRMAEEPRASSLAIVLAGVVVAGAAARALVRPTARRAALAAWAAFVGPALAVALDHRFGPRHAVDGGSPVSLAACVFVAWLVGIYGCWLASRAFVPDSNLPAARVR